MKIVPNINHDYTFQLLLNEWEKHKFNKNWNYRKIGKWSIRWSINNFCWVITFGISTLYLNDWKYFHINRDLANLSTKQREDLIFNILSNFDLK